MDTTRVYKDGLDRGGRITGGFCIIVVTETAVARKRLTCLGLLFVKPFPWKLAFYRTNGNFDVPCPVGDTKSQAFKLYKWVESLHSMFQSYRSGRQSGSLTEERIELLLNHGFQFRENWTGDLELFGLIYESILIMNKYQWCDLGEIPECYQGYLSEESPRNKKSSVRGKQRVLESMIGARVYNWQKAFVRGVKM